MNFHPSISLGLEVTISLGIIVQKVTLPSSSTLVITLGKLEVRTGSPTPSSGGIWNISRPPSESFAHFSLCY